MKRYQRSGDTSLFRQLIYTTSVPFLLSLSSHWISVYIFYLFFKRKGASSLAPPILIYVTKRMATDIICNYSHAPQHGTSWMNQVGTGWLKLIAICTSSIVQCSTENRS